MTAADASPSPGSPSNLNSGLGAPMSRSNLDPMTGSNLDPMGSSMGPLGLGGVGTMGRMGRSSEQRRPGSGEVFPSDLQVYFLAFLRIFKNIFSMLDFTLSWNSSYGKCILLIKKFNIKPNIIFPCKNVFVLSTFCQTLGCDFMM